LLFKVLVPHSFFHLLECELRKKISNPFIHKSIDEFIDLRRAVHNQSHILGEFDIYPTAPIFQTWLMKTLQKGFKFELSQLARAHKHLYSDQMIIVNNVKPAIGELELKLEKKPRNIVYVKVLID
jgi:thiamine kinase-like enzyme